MFFELHFFPIASIPTFYDQGHLAPFIPSRLVSDVSVDEISKKSFPLERQIPPEKLLVIERYVVARK